MQYGITEAGFVRKPFNETLLDLEKDARSKFGNDIDLSVHSPVGAIIHIFAYHISLLWEEREKDYYSLFLSTSTGVSLDRCVAFGGLKRKDPQRAIVKATFIGDENTLIRKGTILETKQGIKFITSTDSVIKDGVSEVYCAATKAGLSGNIPANSLTESEKYIRGVKTISNPAPGYGGSPQETDPELLQRYFIEGMENSGSTTDAIRGEIIKLEGVIACKVYENDKSETDQEGRPPHSIEVVVIGGDDLKIAKAIMKTKSAGIEPFGEIEYTLKDLSGQDKIIRYNRATQKTIYINVELTTNNSYSIDSDKEKSIIIDYINDLAVSEDITAWKIGAALRDVIGIEGVAVKLGIDKSIIDKEKILISDREIALTDPSFININRINAA